MRRFASSEHLTMILCSLLLSRNPLLAAAYETKLPLIRPTAAPAIRSDHLDPLPLHAGNQSIVEMALCSNLRQKVLYTLLQP